MKNNPADAIKDTMWRFLMTGNQKGNPQLLKEYVYDLVQMMTQMTAGQRGNKKDISFDELEPLEWSIVIESTCLVLSGKIDKLIEDKGENNRFGQWISVSDRLPRVGEYVIAYGDNGPKGCCIAFVGSDDEFICEINGYYVEAYGVTHWMPLPEEPNE